MEETTTTQDAATIRTRDTYLEAAAKFRELAAQKPRHRRSPYLQAADRAQRQANRLTAILNERNSG